MDFEVFFEAKRTKVVTDFMLSVAVSSDHDMLDWNIPVLRRLEYSRFEETNCCLLEKCESPSLTVSL